MILCRNTPKNAQAVAALPLSTALDVFFLSTYLSRPCPSAVWNEQDAKRRLNIPPLRSQATLKSIEVFPIDTNYNLIATKDGPIFIEVSVDAQLALAVHANQIIAPVGGR